MLVCTQWANIQPMRLGLQENGITQSRITVFTNVEAKAIFDEIIFGEFRSIFYQIVLSL